MNETHTNDPHDSDFYYIHVSKLDKRIRSETVKLVIGQYFSKH